MKEFAQDATIVIRSEIDKYSYVDHTGVIHCSDVVAFSRRHTYFRSRYCVPEHCHPIGFINTLCFYCTIDYVLLAIKFENKVVNLTSFL